VESGKIINVECKSFVSNNEKLSIYSE